VLIAGVAVTTVRTSGGSTPGVTQITPPTPPPQPNDRCQPPGLGPARPC
jgi:hypothetical protein